MIAYVPIELLKRIQGCLVSDSLIYAEVERIVAAAERRLTLRETEVLKMLADGYSTKEIATELSIAHKTAEIHRANAMKKLGIHNRAELVKYAIREGITDTAPRLRPDPC